MKDRQFGDFQTPPELAKAIVELLGPAGDRWGRVLEPTCGRGSFIRELIESKSPPAEIIGIEINGRYVEEAKQITSPHNTSITILQKDIFKISLAGDLKWNTGGNLLVIGNPPWVTNSEIGSRDGVNLPDKTNFKRIRGIEAMTGNSNFDIAEFIWIKIIADLASPRATISLLCKLSVARNVLKYAERERLPISGAEIRLIDAKKSFGAAVDACLFTLNTGAVVPDYYANVFDSLEAAVSARKIGIVNNKLVANLDLYGATSFLEGECHIQWRQGIKHDAADVMELERDTGGWHNRLMQAVDVEDEYIYPLVKCTDLARNSVADIKRGIIITQKFIGENTSVLVQNAPKLWKYLMNHKERFDARKSRIYNGKTPFSIFGVGEYSFASFKVCISGLHKAPRFIPLGAFDGKPVMCDDTCYFLPCDTAAQAATIAALLNHTICADFISSIMFRDAKRPITKSLLSRINLFELAKRISHKEIRNDIHKNLESINHSECLEDGVKSDSVFFLSLKREKRPVQASLF